MRWSTMHIPTLREYPAEAGAPSHRLLLRAGYIRQLLAEVPDRVRKVVASAIAGRR